MHYPCKGNIGEAEASAGQQQSYVWIVAQHVRRMVSDRIDLGTTDKLIGLGIVVPIGFQGTLFFITKNMCFSFEKILPSLTIKNCFEGFSFSL